MNYSVNTNGLLNKINNSEVSLNIKNDNIYIHTDKNIYNLNVIPCVKKEEDFIFETEDATFIVSYNKVPNSNFITRKISMSFKHDVELLKIGCEFDSNIFSDIFLYKTFYNASGAVFCRTKNLGLAIGFENPFFKLIKEEEISKVEFEPSLYLKHKETFDCDLNFYGIYNLLGKIIKPLLEKSQRYNNGRYLPRYRCPGEGYGLYASEIEEMNNYTKDYFNVDQKEFLFTSYNFFSNLPMKPKTREEIDLYKNHIDAFKEIGGDAIILNPLCEAKLPTKDKNSYWELFPENTPAEEIYKKAKDSGLKIGTYIGTAGNFNSSNSTLVDYDSNKKWKKIDIKGNISEENCICSEDFLDWYIEVQKNTIRKYNLSIWCWDPGPGNGFFCHSKNHGHLPGKGDYLGFRNSLKVMNALKEEFPNLYIQGFHGNKEYGLWGFKYIDQHEGYWENEINVMNPIFPDISPDRITADGCRFQANINYMFRFMPYSLNHGLCHRMFQANWNNLPNNDLLFDRNGYKFALLSAIASGGPVTTPIIPRKPRMIPGYIDFYKFWINWAKQNWEYSKNTVVFNNLKNYGGEAYSKFIDNEGYIFVVNGYPMPINFSFKMDERINYQKTFEKVNINYIWPIGQNYIENVEYRDKISLVVAPYSIAVLEVTKKNKEYTNVVMKNNLPRFLNPTGKKKNNLIFKFKGDLLIKEYLQKQEEYIYEEVNNAGEKFCEFKGLDLSHWYNNHRLWLHILNCSSLPKIKLNDLYLDIKEFRLNHENLSEVGGYFADITDFVAWNKDNIIEFETQENLNLYEVVQLFNNSASYPTNLIHGTKTKRDELPWLFLTYPRPEDENPDQITHSIIKTIPQAPNINKNIQITEAVLNKDNIMIPKSNNTISCKVNIPFEELEGVYVSVPISIGDTGEDLRSDMILNYENGIWTKTFKSGERKDLIIDDNKLVFWAVKKDNTESESYELPIEWLFV